ncbi:hypothetical protein GWN26_02535 [Candidatus Saccharibacteria bacterium]|nr:hypothetical protein [Candidatus Saccharibacteria bacterium]NIV04454.1 hypothetical protein [Calditrichia bacterium]NIV73043.1 hypothetical protein [Calditrichia bacterium]NIV98075.1 hypothetical protein [Candidatus Saccharibacteria bacterium]NIW78366.1 hypothetical protein [Calditrichia bacterium]
MKKLWKFLNGKKTNIGAVLMVAATVLEIFLDSYGLKIEVLQDTVVFLNRIGALIGAGGLGHKTIKRLKNAGK